jgi:hypothetical protein
VRRELPDVDLEVRRELLSRQLVSGLADPTYDLALVGPDPLSSEQVTLRRPRFEPLVEVLASHEPPAERRGIDPDLLAGKGVRDASLRTPLVDARGGPARVCRLKFRTGAHQGSARPRSPARSFAAVECLLGIQLNPTGTHPV